MSSRLFYPILDDLTEKILPRPEGELFLTDFWERQAEFADKIHGSRVLVTGGAGSIGSATLRCILSFGPEALHVIDQNENDLAELVRSIRNQGPAFPRVDLRFLPLDFGSSFCYRFLRGQKPYHFVLHFAAVKHVRSEKDVASILHMLDTNVLKSARLLRWLDEVSPDARVFYVSTDKAADPASFMGASKRLMEQVLFSADISDTARARSTSVRFANVAFSRGSLLESFLFRLAHRQPLAVPRGVRRFFLGQREAARLCMLAAFCVPPGVLAAPRLEASLYEVELVELARRLLEVLGYQAKLIEEGEEVEGGAEDWMARMREGAYPVYLTSPDTSGEKEREILFGAREAVRELGYRDLMEVLSPLCLPGALASFLGRLEDWMRTPEVVLTKEMIAEEVRKVVPEFEHRETGRNLDEQR